jgi:dehydrogenase/reductase SDR family protein 4
LIESFWFWFQKYGKIDVVVSNAAVSPSSDSTLETHESVLDKLWEINVKAAILLLKVIFITKVCL